MTSPVQARRVGVHAWIRRGWDRAIPARFKAETTIDGYDVSVDVVVGPLVPQAARVTVEQPLMTWATEDRPEPVLDAPGVGLTVLRKVTVDQIIREAISQLERPITSAETETGVRGTFRVQGVEEAVWGDNCVGLPGDGPGRDTPTDRLRQVARIYQAAVAAGIPPVKAVAEELASSRSTAGRLVGDARKAGYLQATTPGRTSAVLRPPVTSEFGTAVFMDPARVHRSTGEEDGTR